jgi:hypothetical protein
MNDKQYSVTQSEISCQDDFSNNNVYGPNALALPEKEQEVNQSAPIVPNETR